MERLKLDWELNRFFPRLNISILDGKQSATETILWKVFPFKYRIVSLRKLRYKLPVYFHIPAVRKHYEKKILDVDS